MFEGLFDFAKTRTLKQSVGFFVFYSGVAVCITAVLDLIGLR